MKILLTEDAIRQRVDLLAAQMNSQYGNQPITIVGVLTGCIVLLADLIRRLEMPIRIALIQASSYRGETTTSGELRISRDFLPDLRGRDVVLIDDILDTGKTIAHLKEHLLAMNVQSVRTCVLLRKIGRQVVPFEPDYIGFEIPDEFVVGYGLDYNDEYRNLPYIGVLNQDA